MPNTLKMDEEKYIIENTKPVSFVFGHNTVLSALGKSPVTISPSSDGNNLILAEVPKLVVRCTKPFSLQFDNVLIQFKKITHNCVLVIDSETIDGITNCNNIEILGFGKVIVFSDEAVNFRSVKTGYAKKLSGEFSIVVAQMGNEFISIIDGQRFGIKNPDYTPPQRGFGSVRKVPTRPSGAYGLKDRIRNILKREGIEKYNPDGLSDRTKSILGCKKS